MKSLVARAFLSFAVLATIAVGCAAPDQDEALDEELLTDDAPSAEEQALEPVLLCPDLVVHQEKIVLCGPIEGPLDPSPGSVRCKRTCVTERHRAFIPVTPTSPGGFECVTDGTTCTAWDCPSCD